MLQGTYTAALGIYSHQQRLDTIANNLANVSTNGYKTVRVDFKDALYQEMVRPHGNNQNLNMEKGHGLLVGATKRIHSQGLFQDTGVDTNLLLEGEGFFMIETPGGQRYFTRDGSFTRSVEADGVYLTTDDGLYVLDENGAKITLPEEEDVIVDADGTFWAEGAEAPYTRIGVWNFPNQEGLQAISTNLFAISDASGAAQPVETGLGTGTSVVQRAVEGSNVNLGDEFSRLVRAQRAMQLSSRALSMADEMDGTANTIRR